MAEQMKWLKVRRDSGLTLLYAHVGQACMIVAPAITMAFSWLNIGPPAHDPLWVYGVMGLIGLGCLLMAIIRLLADTCADVRTMTFVLEQVLKDPEEEEAVIRLATYQRLRQSLDLD
jgi:hypothetical protein